MRCLAKADPEFHAALESDLAGIRADLQIRGDLFRRLYNPSLYRMIRTAGFDSSDVRAAGDFVILNGQKIFDAVSGVACSVRGHNPPDLRRRNRRPRIGRRLRGRIGGRDLAIWTGMADMVPAVSGAIAVENALKLALVAQFPRRRVLALRAGFGGKTLFALTGTATLPTRTASIRFTPTCVYVDPFAADAERQIERLLEQQAGGGRAGRVDPGGGRACGQSRTACSASSTPTANASAICC